MNVTITNTGIHPVRVIVDHDTVHDSVIEPNATMEVDALEGVIELRELEEGSEDASV